MGRVFESMVDIHASKPLKIVFIIGSLGAGGAEKQLVLLGKGLLKAGCSVQIITLTKANGSGFSKHITDIQNFTFTGSPPTARNKFKRIFEIPFFLIQLYKYLKVNKPDVVHAWLLQSYVIGMPVAFLAGIPVRISARRGLWSGINGKKWLLLSKISNHFANHFTANSRAVSADAIAFESIPQDKFSIIPNIVSKDDRRANVRLQPARAVVVANLIAYKGHLDLLKAISLTDTDLYFEFVGQGPMLGELLQRTHELGIRNKVNFFGYHPAPIEIMLKAQFAILPSHSEGLPNAILEAQSIGLPVIATRVGGIPEIVRDNLNGVLVNSNSPKELAAAISWMSKNPIERERLSKNSLEDLKNYSSETIVESYLGLYRQLIDSKKS
jgi:glycosyltransferase involved in cell wall biosynthesis